MTPAVFILINDNIVDDIRLCLNKQLQINYNLSLETFDGYVSLDPNYVANEKLRNKRVMVLGSLDDISRRTDFDVVLKVKNGLTSVMYNKFGPPGITYQTYNLTLGKLYVNDNAAINCFIGGA